MDPIVSRGFDLMVYGMGTVFVFLGILVVVTSLMSNLVSRFSPEPEPAPIPPANASSVPGPHLEAIKLALKQHRR